MPRTAWLLRPDVTEGVWVLVAVLVLATGSGLLRAARDGRFRGTHQVRGADANATAAPVSVLAETDLDHVLGERATLLQFSSAFCAPCRVTRRVLGEVADLVPGVVHVEVDAEHHLELTRRLGILRTPTTLVLDAHGREVTRAAGAPTRDSVLGTLSQHLA